MSEISVSAMQADLARSGLSPSDMDAQEVVQAFGGAVTGYRIPYYLPDGSQHPHMHRVRNTIQGVPRYGQPSTDDVLKSGGSKSDATYPYLNPHILGGVTWASVAALTGKRLLIVEGEKKAAAAGKRLKRFALGIGGCWNACSRNDEGVFNLHPVIAALLQPGDKVDVVLDADMLTNEIVNRAAGTLRRALLRLGITPEFVILPDWNTGKMGMDDWLLQQPPGTENAAYDALPRLTGAEGDGLHEDHVSLWDWLGLIRGESGKVLPIEQNIHLILTRHERYVGRLWYDVVEQRIWHVLNDEPAQFTDAQAFHETSWMQRSAGLVNVRRGPVLEAFLSIPALTDLHRNPLLEDIASEPWDGTPRLEEMFIRAFGAEDNQYHREVGRNWLTSAVARVLEPGCQVDTMLILEGVQGLGKSQALKILGGHWYVEVKQAIGEKDFVMAAHHGWLADIIELGAFRYADFNHVKGEITTRIDAIRVPYGRSIEDRPRGFVFVGTTNTKDYLRDETGNRRFWPIACNPVTTDGMIDLAWLTDNRAQLLAEARHRVMAGESWWDVDPALAAAVQALRMETDPWEEAIATILAVPANFRIIATRTGGCHFVTTGEILHGLGIETQFQNSGLMRRVSRIMGTCGNGWAPYHYNGKKALILSNGQTTTVARGYVMPAGQTPNVVVDMKQQRASKF